MDWLGGSVAEVPAATQEAEEGSALSTAQQAHIQRVRSARGHTANGAVGLSSERTPLLMQLLNDPEWGRLAEVRVSRA